MFSDIFKQLIQNSGLTVYQISKDTGISESLMSHWKSGRQLPKYDSLNILADYFKVSGDVLLGRVELVSNNTHNKSKIDYEVSDEGKKNTIIPFYLTPASAGLGSLLSDDTPVEWLTVPKTKETTAADFLLEVRGDSMQPVYFDGDRVLIKKSDRISEGEIGVFILNGEAYIKKMGKSEFISLNPNYENIPVSEYDSISCVGKVIAVLNFE